MSQEDWGMPALGPTGSQQGRLGRMIRSQNGDGWSADEKPRLPVPPWPPPYMAMPQAGNVSPATRWTGLDGGVGPIFAGASCGCVGAGRSGQGSSHPMASPHPSVAMPPPWSFHRSTVNAQQASGSPSPNMTDTSGYRIESGGGIRGQSQPYRTPQQSQTVEQGQTFEQADKNSSSATRDRGEPSATHDRGE